MGRRDRNRRAKRIVPEWMLIREGFIQNIVMDPFGDGRRRRCIPLFPSYGHARSFIDEAYWASGARPCQIGSIRAEADGTRETLDTVIAAASSGELHFNMLVLEKDWFAKGVTAAVDELVIHELAHHFVGSHTHPEPSERIPGGHFYDACCHVAAKAMDMLRRRAGTPAIGTSESHACPVA